MIMTMTMIMTITMTMIMTITMTFRKHPQRPILETCDLWDTDNISDNREQQS